MSFNAKDIDYKETRKAVMAYVEGKTARSFCGHEDRQLRIETQEHSGDWWSGTYDYGCVNDDSNEQEINYSGYAAKGKGGGDFAKKQTQKQVSGKSGGK